MSVSVAPVQGLTQEQQHKTPPVNGSIDWFVDVSCPLVSSWTSCGCGAALFFTVCPSAPNWTSLLIPSHTRLRSSTRTRPPCWWGCHRAGASSPPSSGGRTPRARTDPPRSRDLWVVPSSRRAAVPRGPPLGPLAKRVVDACLISQRTVADCRFSVCCLRHGDLSETSSSTPGDEDVFRTLWSTVCCVV